jgi:hypothetical protein
MWITPDKRKANSFCNVKRSGTPPYVVWPLKRTEIPRFTPTRPLALEFSQRLPLVAHDALKEIKAKRQTSTASAENF